jgi:hypothetical protein
MQNAIKLENISNLITSQVISMLEFLIDNIFISIGGTLFQQVVSIPMGTNCGPLLADLFSYSYESEFLQNLWYVAAHI